MSAYGTKLAEGFSSKVMSWVYDRSLIDEIVNRNYEGEINAVGSKLNILDFDKISEKTYSNAAMSADSITENNGQLVIDQYKSFYPKAKTLAMWLSYIKNPMPYIVTQMGGERNKNMDAFVLGKYSDVGAGNRIGTDYETGTVTITVTTGAVVGSGTTFTEAMVGKGFKAEGHTTWYRVATFTDTENITIEDDLDDVDSVYSGGAIAGGATFTVEAATVLTITSSNVLAQVAKAREILNLAEKNGYSAVPDEDRWLIAPPEFFTTLTQGTGIALHVDEVYQTLVKKGYMGELQGFKLFMSNRLSGNNTDGYHLLFGHKNWMTFAEKVLQARMEEDLTGDFGTAYKDLFVYGGKVKDVARHQAGEIFAKFA
jgi:hypothetical protein